jgi:AraC family transcriptional regulator of adaptative response/methylated-DNA-[protein]-cysteine methyltransferase
MKSRSSARSPHAALHYRFTIMPWDLAPLLVAVSERGLAFVSFETDPAKVFAPVASPINPQLHWEQDVTGLVQWCRQLTQWLQRLQGPFPAPVDWQGTAFQKQVWQLLCSVPRGTVCSYTQLACRLGQPWAARAVARACAANRLALVVPCHRVIRSNGSLGGYRWGIDLKRRLLAYEGLSSVDRKLRHSPP